MKNKNEAVELKECPCCGGKAIVSQFLPRWNVGCLRCELRTKDAFSRESAIEAWNTRTPTQCKSDDGKGTDIDHLTIAIEIGCDNKLNYGQARATANYLANVLGYSNYKCACGNGLDKDKLLEELFSNPQKIHTAYELDLYKIVNFICDKVGKLKPSTRSDMPVMPTDKDVDDLFSIFLYPIEKEDWFVGVRKEFKARILQLLKSKGW